MPIEHVNRKGTKYLLQAGRTKTGKPKYWLGQKLTGLPVEELPEGYEIYENPDNAQPYLRKQVRSPILPIERELLEDGIRRVAGLKHFIVDVQGASLVVYTPDTDPELSSRTLGWIMGSSAAQMADFAEWTAKTCRYSKMLRFTLVDEGERLFDIERWCFRGSIDNFISLYAKPQPLPDLSKRSCRTWGKRASTT